MTINALNIIPCKTDYCPTMGDYAIKKKMNVSKGKQKVGDIVLFDFNHNGTSDHIGIVVGLNGSKVITIEGNTGAGNNTNGGQVQRRERALSQINYFVRPKYTNEITPAMVIATATKELGTVESPKNSNKVKYNRWYYGSNKSAYWCCTFVCYIFAHIIGEMKPVDKPTGKYSGTLPTSLVKYGTKGNDTLLWQKFLNWYHADWKLAEDGECGSATAEATSIFQLTEGITADGEAGNDTYAKAKAYLGGEKGYDGTFPNVEVTYSVPKGQLIADKANEIAWSTNTDKANYKGGDSTSAFKVALNKAYPNRSSWGKAPRKGASCDVAVGTTVRASGVDSSYPRGLDEQKKHLPKSIFKKTKVTKVADLKNGDIFYYSKGTHTAIYSGGKTKEAGYEHYYMKTMSSASDRLKKCGYYVWRATGTAIKTREWLQKGDKNDNVRYLQNFLNWYGGYSLDTDGDFGTATEKAVKDFQTKESLAVDGQFGKSCLAKAKEVKR